MDRGRQAALTGIGDREELIYLLSKASELEHGLCCCYLFAAFSLKRSVEEDLTAPELEAVARWERTISAVAVQEMGHLALVSNLLTAVGAAPHLRRPNLPQRSKYYPPSLQMSLRPLDARTLDHFIFIERPEGMNLADAAGFEIAPDAVVSPVDGIEPGEIEFASVGELYRDLEQGLKELAARLGEERLFLGPPRAQATPAYFPIANLAPVTDLASAINVIELIVEQGEGLRGDIENSHYARFLGIRAELERLRAARPGFEPARAVLENPYADPPPDCTGYNLIQNPEARSLSTLFNASYALMIELLLRFFAHTEESDEELATLVRTAVGVMEGVIKPLGPILTSLPAGLDGDTPRAGPSFALYRSIDYLPHRDAAWTLFGERFEELAGFSGRLAADGSSGLGLDAVHAAVERLGANLRRHAPSKDAAAAKTP